jgi:hypothetical protein
MNIEKDETLIRVSTPLGANCGEFVFPTKALYLLELLNDTEDGYYFVKQ